MQQRTKENISETAYKFPLNEGDISGKMDFVSMYYDGNDYYVHFGRNCDYVTYLIVQRNTVRFMGDIIPGWDTTSYFAERCRFHAERVLEELPLRR